MRRIYVFFKKSIRSTSLFFSCALNLLYISANLLSGLFYKSLWYFSVTLCHILLFFNRLYLFSKTKQGELKENEKFKIGKIIGASLFGLNILVLVMSVYSLVTEKSLSYGKTQFPILAIYSLYSVVLSLIEIFRSEKNSISPQLLYRNITLSTALISLYNLIYSLSHNSLYSSNTAAILVALSLSLVFGLSLFIQSAQLVNFTRNINKTERF